MEKKNELEVHASLIRELHGKGKTIDQILQALLARKVVVGRETLRKWVHADPESAALPKKTKGRPRSDHLPLFRFLPDDPAKLRSNIEYPDFLLAFLSVAYAEDFRLAAVSRAIKQAGIPVNEDRPLLEWTIPGRVLGKLSDLEICLLAYLLSGYRAPLPAKHEVIFGEWLQGITAYGSRLKAKIMEGGDYTVGELSRATKGDK